MSLYGRTGCLDGRQDMIRIVIRIVIRSVIRIVIRLRLIVSISNADNNHLRFVYSIDSFRGCKGC